MKLSKSANRLFDTYKAHLREQIEAGTYPVEPPTIRELRDRMGFKSTSSVSLHIGRLVEAGLLVRGRGGAAYLSREVAKEFLDER